MSLGAFGKYELLKKVGSGGMGELYLARLPGIEGFEKLVVIKRILPHLVAAERSATFVDMFLEEARLAARLSHPNIVQIHDLGKVDDIYYIAMEYVYGVDLRRLLRKGEQRGRVLPVQHAVKICSLLCEALGYAHELRDADGKPLHLVHRDVSSHNVLVAFDGGVKLTDFGIAKVASRDMHTKAGTLKGKLRYMSPEQTEGLALDHRSDLFSLGVLLYELSTGRRPFDGPSEYEIMQAIVSREPPDPCERIADYPPALATLLRRALAKDREQRFQQAIDLQLELERFLVDQRQLSSATLIGQYVSALFDDVVPAQAEGSAAAGDTSSLLRHLVTSTPSNSPLNPDAFAALGQTTSGVFADPSGQGENDEEDAGPTRQFAVAAAQSRGDEPEISSATQRALGRTFRSRETHPARGRLVAILVVIGLVSVAISLWLLGRSPPATGLEERAGVDAAAALVTTPDLLANAAVVADGGAALDAGATSAPGEVVARATGSADGGAATEERDAGTDARRSSGRQPDPDTKKSPAAVETGTLTLASQPWSEVFLGSRSLGLTPLAEVRLPAGAHRLVLRNPRVGLEKEVWVRIRPGRTTALKVNLSAP